MDEPHDEIARLEAEIETLREQAERGRKVELGAKALVAFGFCSLAAILFGILRTDGVGLLMAIAAALAGIVLYGSNRSTLADIASRIDALEARRLETIRSIRFRVIEGGLRADGTSPTYH